MRNIARTLPVLALVVALVVTTQAQQPWFTDVLPAEEFAARRARVIEQIGDGIAILQGAVERPAESPFRQNNQFFYLTGVEVPRSILIIDGRAKKSALYLPDTSRWSRAWGRVLEAGDEASRITGIEAVLKREEAEAAIAAAGAADRVIYTPHRPEVLGSGSAGDATAWQRATTADPWDGRPSREQTFIEKVKAAGAAIRGARPGPDARYHALHQERTRDRSRA